MRMPRPALIAVLLPLAMAGCHSRHIDLRIENRTGEPVQLLEVDYPSASFGKNLLAKGENYLYRIQVRGSGVLKVQYTTRAGQPVVINGPALAEAEEGQLGVILLPGGKAEFRQELRPPK